LESALLYGYMFNLLKRESQPSESLPVLVLRLTPCCDVLFSLSVQDR